MDEKLAKGHLFRVEMTVALPCEATAEEAAEWIEFHVTQSGGMSCDNPLADHSIEAWRHEIEVEALGRIGTRVEFDHKPNDRGGMTYRVRYEERPA